MMKLVYVLCLTTSLPNSCDGRIDQTVILDREVTPFMCALRAQEKVAEDLGSLASRYRLFKWSCKPAEGADI